MYGMASALPTKYNLDPVVVSTYNVMMYATHRTSEERMRALFSMSLGRLVAALHKHRMLYLTVYPDMLGKS